MPWSDSVSFTLELTRLLPPAIKHTSNATVNFARSLQSSGSDIVIEQDIGALFSRFLVDESFAEEFKTRALSVNSVRTISDRLPLALQSGPGPTVQRALKEPAFMPMIIHLSMLGATHDYGSLAEALSCVLMTQCQRNDPENPLLIQPSTIRGLIQACVEQTSGFKWHLLVHTIMSILKLPAYDVSLEYEQGAEADKRGIFFSLTTFQLETLLECLLAVSRVYRDNTVVVEGRQGAIPMILWSHYVLGLTVLVKGSPAGSIAFGNGPEALIIDLDYTVPFREIYMMGPSRQTELQFQKPFVGETADLLGRRLLPVLGYARYLLAPLQEGEDAFKTLSESAQRELAHCAAALAYSAATNLFDTHTEVKAKKHCRNFLSEHPSLVVLSAKLILGDFYDEDAIGEMMRWARTWRQPSLIPLPSSLYHLSDTPKTGSQQYQQYTKSYNLARKRHTKAATALAQLILAFGAVGDLDQCQDLTVGDILLSLFADNYIGQGDNFVLSNSWFDLISHLLRGERTKLDIDINSWCLWSHHGWTVYKETLRDTDPSDCQKTRVWIQPGVPVYNGVSARRIKDGPTNFEQQGRLQSIDIPSPADIGSWKSISARGATSAVTSHISTATEDWKLSRRFAQGPPEATLVSAGCSILHEALRAVRVIKADSCCTHLEVGPVSPRNRQVPLDSRFQRLRVTPSMGFTSAYRFGRKEDAKGCRVVVALTCFNAAARWLAILGWYKSDSNRLAVLRHDTLCVQCFVESACQMDDEGGGLYLIL